MSVPLEPLQWTLGPPAFISHGTVPAGGANWHDSNDKAKCGLGERSHDI